MDYMFTSESVSEGHPDKVCDRISDSLLDAFISRDSHARTAIEAMATTNRVIIAGETCSSAPLTAEEMDQTVRQAIQEIGYQQDGFNWRNVKIENLLHAQSCDIALGVDRDGAGDQGIMFGYAKKEAGYHSDYMPLAIYYASRILEELSRRRHLGLAQGLEPDAKSQLTLLYADGQAVKTSKLVVSTQHQENRSIAEIREMISSLLPSVLPPELLPEPQDILINPTGRFVIGGPDGDAGLTGRKIIVDTYGGYAPHGGGAFSGKDPTKVDRSAAYLLRYLTKNIVAAGLADECLMQISYAIGLRDPLSLYLNCNGTNKVDESRLLSLLREMIDFTPRGIINRLQLNRPIYKPTSSYGHFGRPIGKNGEFSWEKLDLAEELKKCF